MPPERPARPSRPRLPTPGVILVGVLLIMALTLFNADPGGLTLRYGQFKEILAAPGVTLRNVRVGPSEIRGEILTRDRVTDPDPPKADPKAPVREPGVQYAAFAFRVARAGLEGDRDLVPLLESRAGTGLAAEEDAAAARSALSLVVWLLTIGGMLAIGLILVRSMGGGSPFSFGRSKHKMYADVEGKVTFADVAGIDEAKAELTEVVDFLRRPERYQALGGRIPKGVLLVGPPGTGKTLLARAVAGEAAVPFFSISGSDFVEMFAGVGASRVRDLFRDAESKAPCIIFIDELDAMGKTRTNNAFGSHEEREQTLNQLLVEMDGFDTNRGVILMAATNRPEILDQALLRPGRFDRTVVVDRPDIDGREMILKVHARNVKLGEDVNLRRIAALSSGQVGADLANLVNEAALLAARAGKEAVTMADFNEAIERSAVGLQRKSKIMRPDEKRRIAVHEAGHALVACATPKADPVHKVSIIPRGVGVGGYVLQRPDEDRSLMTRSELEGMILLLLGGTIAEEVVYGEISTGASNDLMRVNGIAQRMVTEFGMSRLGRIYYRESEGMAFLGGQGEGGFTASGESAREVELEIRAIVEDCLARVRTLLGEHRGTLDGIADRLVEVEVIDGRELLRLLDERGFPVTEGARKGLRDEAAETGHAEVPPAPV